MAKTARTIGWAAVAVMAAAGPAFADEPTLVLRVDNRPRITSSVLKDAQAVANEVFGAAGVQVRWADAGPGASQNSAHVTVVLLAGVMEQLFVDQSRASQHVLGFAPRESGRIYVFVDRVTARARRNDRSLQLVLGRVIAHEVGHQLLPEKGHSQSGIMRATIDYGPETSRFTANQTQSIHALLSVPTVADDDARVVSTK